MIVVRSCVTLTLHSSLQSMPEFNSVLDDDALQTDDDEERASWRVCQKLCYKHKKDLLYVLHKWT